MICNITIEEEKRSSQNAKNWGFGGDGRNRNQQGDFAGTGRQQMQQDANSVPSQIKPFKN